MAKYCRICTESYAVLIPILKDDVLVDRINTVTRIKVSIFDQLSTLICNPCLEITAIAWEFYEHVQKTNEAFSSILALVDDSYRLCRMCHCGYDDVRDLGADDRTCNRISLLYQINIKQESKVPNLICKPCLDTISYSWKFFFNAQRKQILLKEKFNIKLKEENLIDLNAESDSDVSSITVTDSDDLLQELYVESVEENISENFNKAIPRKKKRRKRKQLSRSDGHKFTSVIQGTDRPSQNFTNRDDDARNYNKQETNKISPLDAINNTEITSEASTSKEFPFIEYEAPIFFCDFCFVSFDTKHRLLQHQRRHKLKLWSTAFLRNQHEESKFLSAYGDRQCTKCLKIFSSPQGLAFHRQLFGDYHTLSCDLCSRAFVDVYDFDAHEKAHQYSFSRSCRVCLQDFSTFGILGQHEMSHKRQTLKDETPYECAICASSFKDESETKEHITTHRFKKHDNWETFSNLIENSVICYDNLKLVNK